MGHHRTPEELLAQALEKVNNLKLKVAQKQISNDPRMKSLLTDEKEIKKELPLWGQQGTIAGFLGTDGFDIV